MTASDSAEKQDGRHRRSAESRKALLNAALDLIAKGNLTPTAQEIVDQANVGIRTLFRQFETMEDLYAAIDERTRKGNEARFDLSGINGSLYERLSRTVTRLAEGYENLQNVFLFAQNQAWRSPEVKRQYIRGQRLLRKNLEACIPEIAELPLGRREAFHAIASFEMWRRLREHQHLGVNAATDVIYDQLLRIIRDFD